MQFLQQSVSRTQIVSSHIKYQCERHSVCERETAGVCLCMPGVCVCVCVCLSLRLKVACVSRWSEYFPKEQRADVLWVCVCVCMSGQVWRYEEADGFYGDGGDGDTTHTSIRAQRGNGWRWHWWVCDVISCSQWRDSLKGLAELWTKLWVKTITAFLNHFGEIEGLSGRISMSVAAHDSLVRRRASGVLSFSAWHLQTNEKIIWSIRAAAPH